MMAENKQAMATAYNAQIARYGTPISNDLYQNLREYAKEHKVRITGFRNFVGDIATIKTIIDDISEIAEDFPAILEEKQRIVIEFDYDMSVDDFATTDSGHIIHLNALYFSDLEKLKREYNEAVESSNFVAGTDWRGICRHETGHVVANIFHIDSMPLIMKVLNMRPKADIFYHLMKKLSIYSTKYVDGREIIAECFSGYYSKVGNAIADAFTKECLKKGR